MTDQITLTVDGKLYEGWVETEVRRSLGSFANSFNLSYIDRWSDDVLPWPIRSGAECQLKYGEHLLITGFVDVTTFRIQADQWILTAAGRSKTGDLVDCSAIHKTGQWLNKTITEIAKDLCAPYGLDVTIAQPDRTPIQRFTIEEGESVHDALDRLTKNRGYLCHTLADGNVGFFRLDPFVGVIGQVPVEEAIEREYYEDDQDRFSEYRLRSQSYGESDEDGAEITILRKWDAEKDEGVTRHRPLVVVADSSSNLVELRKRATWERNVRAGRSVRVRYTFPGILDERGFAWTPGDQHHVRDLALGVDEDLLLVDAEIQVDERKLQTRLEFTRPESFTLLEWPSDVLNKVTKRGRPLVKKAPVIDQQRGGRTARRGRR